MLGAPGQFGNWPESRMGSHLSPRVRQPGAPRVPRGLSLVTLGDKNRSRLAYFRSFTASDLSDRNTHVDQ